MTISTILLKCHCCTEKIGSLDVDDISLVSAEEEVVQFLVTNKMHITCDNCQDCQHEFED